MSVLSRRHFFRSSAARTGAALSATALGFDLKPAIAAARELKISRTTQTTSICPYCAVGCSVVIHTLGDKARNVHPTVVHIEGDPDSPVNEGRLCPKGATAMQLAVSSRRVPKPLYRAPGSDKWEEVSWDAMLDKLALRIKESRDATFVTVDANGNTVNRCEGIAFAGGATFSSEEGYFAAKLMRTLGVVHIEQQARV